MFSFWKIYCVKCVVCIIFVLDNPSSVFNTNSHIFWIFFFMRRSRWVCLLTLFLFPCVLLIKLYLTISFRDVYIIVSRSPFFLLKYFQLFYLYLWCHLFYLHEWLLWTSLTFWDESWQWKKVKDISTPPS